MLDKSTEQVLNAINDNCQDNTYIIIKNEDITPYFKKKKKLDDEAIKETVNYLAEREYIKLKYSDEEGTYCLTMLPKGRLHTEDKKEQKYKLKQQNKQNRKFLLYVLIVSGLSAFFGALVALVVVNYYLGG